MCHVVIVRMTRRTRVSDTVYFKHKYLTQPTMTQADHIVKAYQDLILAIQGMSNTKGTEHMEALTRIKDLLELQGKRFVDQGATIERNQMQADHSRLVFNPSPTKPAEFQHDPRVPMEVLQHIVDNPMEAVMPTTVVLPKPILKVKPMVEASLTTTPMHMESIANRVKNHQQAQDPATLKNETIADRVARHCHECAYPARDQETSKLLKYHTLLQHP